MKAKKQLKHGLLKMLLVINLMKNFLMETLIINFVLKLIKKSNKTNRLGDYLVEFDDKNNECIACAMCAKRCPDMAIEVYKDVTK